MVLAEVAAADSTVAQVAVAPAAVAVTPRVLSVAAADVEARRRSRTVGIKIRSRHPQ